MYMYIHNIHVHVHTRTYTRTCMYYIYNTLHIRDETNSVFYYPDIQS